MQHLCLNQHLVASTQGKVVALQIARMLKQQEPLNPPKLANTCYSLLSPNYGISIAAVYNALDDKIQNVDGAGGVSPETDPDGHIRILKQNMLMLGMKAKQLTYLNKSFSLMLLHLANI